MYEIVELKKTTICGICVKTSNKEGKCLQDIGMTWQQLHETMKTKEDVGTLIGLYTEYEGDFTEPYTFVAGFEKRSDVELDEQYEEFEVKQGKYACFQTKGEYKSAVSSLWQQIWTTPLSRKYI